MWSSHPWKTDGLLIIVLVIVQGFYAELATAQAAPKVSDVLRSANEIAAITWKLEENDQEKHCLRRIVAGAASPQWDQTRSPQGVPYKAGGRDNEKCFLWKHSPSTPGTDRPIECLADKIDERPLSASLHLEEKCDGKCNSCTTGVDCIGLVSLVWGLKKHVTIVELGKYAQKGDLTEAKWLASVPAGQETPLQPGDALVWIGKSIEHAAIVHHLMPSREAVCIVAAPGWNRSTHVERNAMYEKLSWSAATKGFNGVTPYRLRLNGIVLDSKPPSGDCVVNLGDVTTGEKSSGTGGSAQETKRAEEKHQPIHKRPTGVALKKLLTHTDEHSSSPLIAAETRSSQQNRAPTQAENVPPVVAQTSTPSTKSGDQTTAPVAVAENAPPSSPSTASAHTESGDEGRPAAQEGRAASSGVSARDARPHHSWLWWLIPWHWGSRR